MNDAEFFTTALKRGETEYLEVRDYDTGSLSFEASGSTLDDTISHGEVTLNYTEVNDLIKWLTAWRDRARCQLCHQQIRMHETIGLWVSARDVVSGTCHAALIEGWNDSRNGRHAPEEKS